MLRNRFPASVRSREIRRLAGLHTSGAVVYAVPMTDRQDSFRIHRNAAAKIPTQRKAEEFPVTVTQGVQKFQTKKGRSWHTVCTVPDGEQGRKNLTHHYGTVLGRKLGKDFRFVIRAK